MDCGNRTYRTISYHFISVRCYLSRPQVDVFVRVHKRKSLDLTDHTNHEFEVDVRKDSGGISKLYIVAEAEGLNRQIGLILFRPPTIIAAYSSLV
jgi:hypothetical protein